MIRPAGAPPLTGDTSQLWKPGAGGDSRPPKSGGTTPTPAQAVEIEGQFQVTVDWAARALLSSVVEIEEWLKMEEEGRTRGSDGRMWSHRLVLTAYLAFEPTESSERNWKARVRDATMYVRSVQEHVPETAITLEEVKLILRIRQGAFEQPELTLALPLLAGIRTGRGETAQAIEWITTPYADRIEGTDGSGPARRRAVERHPERRGRRRHLRVGPGQRQRCGERGSEGSGTRRGRAARRATR